MFCQNVSAFEENESSDLLSQLVKRHMSSLFGMSGGSYYIRSIVSAIDICRYFYTDKHFGSNILHLKISYNTPKKVKYAPFAFNLANSTPQTDFFTHTLSVASVTNIRYADRMFGHRLDFCMNMQVLNFHIFHAF